ncbi:SAM-dependent methyltransferase [Flavobacterium arcticum]|uniref:SAM-dependent methyltransferase n=1 Tax=Flavobacterium arcticum TaxID=1784713 RepID=A0A345H917_9FLAO|nr:methyltransferase [Flavobacterium arcticum]AXG73077.1 SAM-dependent methyltransferase [Flavobacterium arcticum]KAF2512869.1 SAM-dependent methyltransferase [Flavobacterium arcticum]
MTTFDKKYWEERYLNDSAPWDMGKITPPIKEYINQLTDKSLKILIPGAGNGHEFEHLIHQAFYNSYVLDIAPSPLENIQKRLPELDTKHLILDDFFKHEGLYDLIIEQTFFCALDPSLRKQYAEKMHSLLAPNGKLVGLLFQFPLTEKGPPFGGNTEEYIATFKGLFNIRIIETAYNSIKPREGKELFFIFEKK